mmetsp:Transcript_32413/g.61036  ORF Transcript_32413/g.61036 Transcript_32413/m.61036 type:complete len:276 (+) Transcript_32413:54-881(+)
MVELVRVIAEDLRDLNVNRKGPSDLGRAHLFRAHCLLRLRDASATGKDFPADFVEALIKAERGLINVDVAVSGTEMTSHIDATLGRLCMELRQLEAKALEADRQRMEALSWQEDCAMKIIPHRKLVTLCIRTFSGKEIEVACGLDENMLCLKQHIHDRGGPQARDQKLIWSRPELAWIHGLDIRAQDSFSLFYLGVSDGDCATLYYVRFCNQCRGACRCIECHGGGVRGGCVACGEVRPDCVQCDGPCRCPSCHGRPSLCNGICRVCGESSTACA